MKGMELVEEPELVGMIGGDGEGLVGLEIINNTLSEEIFLQSHGHCKLFTRLPVSVGFGVMYDSRRSRL